jgi:dUTP pyrophosphatase
MTAALRIRRFDTELPLPEYKTAGAAAFDLCARIETVVAPGTIAKVPLNVAISPPEGHWILLAARSSLHKKGLMPGNGIGVGDNDFSGNDDEYQILVYNFTDQPVTVERGERIAQAVVMPNPTFQIQEVDRLEAPNRGGFGTTGSHT